MIARDRLGAALAAGWLAAGDAPAMTAGRDDVHTLIALDAEFAESGETTLPEAKLQRLADLGWIEEGDGPNEIKISHDGCQVLATLDQQVSAITTVIVAEAEAAAEASSAPSEA